MQKNEAHDFVMVIIKKCRVDPLHDHWVYDCPDVLDALTEFGELKVAEGVVEARRQMPCWRGNVRCWECRSCVDLRAADERVAAWRKAHEERLLKARQDMPDSPTLTADAHT